MPEDRGHLVDRATGELIPVGPGELCRRCAQDRYTCCQTEYGVSVTFHDARRLQRATGQRLEDFLKIGRLPSRIARVLRQDPVFGGLFLGKRRLLQLRQRGLDCHFLGPAGCTVPAARPQLCRLFPFWFQVPDVGDAVVDFDGIRTPKQAARSPCMLVQAVWPSREASLAFLGESEATLAARAAQLAREVEWQRDRIRELRRRVRPREVTVAMLAPWIEGAAP